MEDYKEKIINKFVLLSNKYHKMSLLFYELSQSLKFHSKTKSVKEFKEIIKNDLNLDFKKIEKLTKSMAEIKLNDLQKEQEQ